MKFPRQSTIEKHPLKWLDLLGRQWLFQEDFPMTESVRQWHESSQWDDSCQLVFIFWGKLEDVDPPLSQDGAIELSRADERRVIERRVIVVSQIYDESGFKLAALVELV